MVKNRSSYCYHCGEESTENKFKYYNNGKRTQARYQCSNCQKDFTLGSEGRPQGKIYKERNVDPIELRGLFRECRWCGEANNAPFKYYNNKNLLQPRFKCLNCGQQFQMRLEGTGEERHLEHTSSYQRPPNYPKQSVTPISDHASTFENKIWMPSDEEPKDFPYLSEEDARYLGLIEGGLKDEDEAPPPEVVLRLRMWASKLPKSWR